jgi:hypothetical protein
MDQDPYYIAGQTFKYYLLLTEPEKLQAVLDKPNLSAKDKQNIRDAERQCTFLTFADLRKY